MLLTICCVVALAADPAPTPPPAHAAPREGAHGASPAPISAGPAAAGAASEPAEGGAVRVGGDVDAAVERAEDGGFRWKASRIDTPLPAGYPAPTPPGAIDLKRYPSVRRAEVSGTMAPDLGMNFAFFPLFNHIKDRGIAMTSPVEMDYSGVAKDPPEGGDAVPAGWTMSFLYRTSDLGPTGPDEKRKNVKVVDAPAVTVISLGVRGSYDFSRMRAEWKKLEAWLASQTEWDAAGQPRALHYNGPDVPARDRWSEVQIPVRRAVRPEAAAAPTPGAAPASVPSAPAPADPATPKPAPR